MRPGRVFFFFFFFQNPKVSRGGVICICERRCQNWGVISGRLMPDGFFNLDSKFGVRGISVFIMERKE